MTGHDPLCPLRASAWPECSYCALIARVVEREDLNMDAAVKFVRADERKKHAREMAEASRRLIALRKEMEARVLYAKAEARADERERIAQEIELQPIDAWGSQAPRGPVSFARAEAFLRAARIARGESDA